MTFEDFLCLPTGEQMHLIDGADLRHVLKIMIHMERRIRPFGDEPHELDATYSYCGLLIQFAADNRQE